MSLIRCANGHMFSKRRHGNTCPYCNMLVEQNDKGNGNNTGEMDENSIPYLGELDVIEPVTGWLVCIEGPQIGQDYRIIAEKNFVGRSEEMHIQIIGDNTISRRNHAVIVYDPKKRNFFLLPGDAPGLAYHNNEAVYSPVEITAYSALASATVKTLISAAFLPISKVYQIRSFLKLLPDFSFC